MEYRVWSLGVNQGAKARWMEAQKSKCKGANRPKACAKVQK